MEQAHYAISEEVSAVVSQTDEFSVQQQKLAKAMQKLERNLDDMTDNFHRSQTDIIRKASVQASGVDEATITKIRGTIFDVQEQQSKFQNQIDMLLQNSNDQEKSLEKINTDIQDLRVCIILFFFII